MEARRIALTVVSALLVCAAIVVVFSNSTRVSTSNTQLAYNPSKISTGGSHSGGTTLGSNLFHTFTTTMGDGPYPIFSGQDKFDAPTAEAAGWVKVAGGACTPGLGVEWASSGSVSKEQPLSVYFTPAGQLTGLKMTIYGSSGDFTDWWGSSEAFKGPAALGNMVSQGYYIPIDHEPDTWEMSVSFRAADDVCSETTLAADIGDRIIINQHTIAKSIPMTKTEAAEEGWQPGSCMTQMGQHYFYDLETGYDMTFKTGNLLPVTPMYAIPDGKINAIFFSTPACQDDTGPRWDNFPMGCALPAYGMCNNWCNKDCPAAPGSSTPWTSPVKTNNYGTYHVFFNTKAGADDVKCPDEASNYVPSNLLLKAAGSAVGRTCPADTPEAIAAAAHPCSSWNIFRIGC